RTSEEVGQGWGERGPEPGQNWTASFRERDEDCAPGMLSTLPTTIGWRFPGRCPVLLGLGTTGPPAESGDTGGRSKAARFAGSLGSLRSALGRRAEWLGQDPMLSRRERGARPCRAKMWAI